jgi:PAS domain S-box-containing protein
MYFDPEPASASGAEMSLERCRVRIAELEAQLKESEETLEALTHGDFDAIVTKDARIGQRVYTLENADHPYRVLIERIQEAAVTLSSDGTIFYSNLRLAELLDTPLEQVIGHKLQPFIRPDDRALFEQLLNDAHHGHSKCELTLRTGCGVEIPAYVSLSMMPNDDGHLLLCGVVADLTSQKMHLRELSDANEQLIAAGVEREKIEEALRQSQKMEAVGQLTGGLAHDFNNLLAVIVGSLEMLQSDLREAGLSGFDEYVNAAMASSERGAALTHRLLAFSRRQTLDPKFIEPNELISGMEDLLRRTVGPSISIETVLSPNVGSILCDANQLENALLNLAINARDAMPGGGRLTIATANVDLNKQLAATRNMAPGEYVSLSVTDVGVGMSSKVIERAFDPFFTTKPLGQGTGLGLSMIYGFAKQSGGDACIESSEGVGTVVSIYVPRHQSRATAVVGPMTSGTQPLAETGETVLVVDDEPGIRMILTKVLKKLGYVAIEAATGGAALRHVEGEDRIDLLVTDVGLPGGINGRQLADAARALRPGLKVLFITGYAGAAIADNSFMGPGMDVLTKPFRTDAVALKIKEMIAGGLTPSKI